MSNYWIDNNIEKPKSIMTITFLSPSTIVQQLLSSLSNADRISLKNIQREDLIQFHHTTGRWIRNKYNLWDEANPYTDENNHPDDISQQIIEELYDLLHQ